MKRRVVAGMVIGFLTFLVGLFSGYWLNERMGSQKIEVPNQLVETPQEEPDQEAIGISGYAKIIDKKKGEDSQGEPAYQLQLQPEDSDLIVTMAVSPMNYKALLLNDEVMIHYTKLQNEIQDGYLVYDMMGKLILKEDLPLVVVDAGHGGFDNGDGSNGVWEEKDMNLQISLKMKEALEAAGIRVIMSREEDVFVPLFDRCALANYVDADLFISNHLNYFDATANGLEVIYSLKADENLANQFAEKIAAYGSAIRGVHSRADDRFPHLDYYAVHEYTNMPSYIIEYGFADSPVDSSIIENNWEQMAKDVATVIAAYLKE